MNNNIIVLYGNPGSGKSTICNTLVGDPVFHSGISIGKGLTTEIQQSKYKDNVIVDTPGLDDIFIRENALKEIEKSLQYNKNYKIIFVITLESGRIRPCDIVTINIILDSIKCEFSYGILFNKITAEVKDKFVQDHFQLQEHLCLLSKPPLSLSPVIFEERCFDKENQLLCDESKNRIEQWLNTIPFSLIQKENVAFNKNLGNMYSKIKDVECKMDQSKAIVLNDRVKEIIVFVAKVVAIFVKTLIECLANNKK